MTLSEAAAADDKDASETKPDGTDVDATETASLTKKLSKYEYILSQEFVDAFWAQVRKRPNGDCWQWMGSLHRQGCGRLQSGGFEFGAHRVAWELAHGPIPTNRIVVHKEGVCNNRGCVNPEHYELAAKYDKTRKRNGRKKKGTGIQYDPVYEDDKMLPSMFHVKHFDAYDGTKVFMDPQPRDEPPPNYAPDLETLKRAAALMLRRTKTLEERLEQLHQLPEEVRQLREDVASLAPTEPPPAPEPPSRDAAPPPEKPSTPLLTALATAFRTACEEAGKEPSPSFDASPLLRVNELALTRAGMNPEAAAQMVNHWASNYVSLLLSFEVPSPRGLLSYILSTQAQSAEP